MQKNIIYTLVLSVFIAIFAILNAAAVQVNLIFAKVNVSAALVILISASIGAIIVYSIDTVYKLKVKKQIKEHEKNILSLTNENEMLKNKNKNFEVENNDLKEINEKYNAEIIVLKKQLSEISK